jgi:hypothetical protein
MPNKVVCDLRQVDGFLRVSSNNNTNTYHHDITEIYIHHTPNPNLINLNVIYQKLESSDKRCMHNKIIERK